MKNLFLFSFAFCALLLANDPFKMIRADELDKLLHGKTKTVDGIQGWKKAWKAVVEDLILKSV